MRPTHKANRLSHSGCVAHQRPAWLPATLGHRMPALHMCMASSQRPAPSTRNTLDSLDALLGQSELEDVAGQPRTDVLHVSADGTDDLVEWWNVRPKQAAPPRQTGMAPGSHGRFVMSEDLLKLGDLRVGRKTQLDGQLELPKVQPLLCFMLLLINLACYGTYVNVNILQGPDAAMEFLSGLWLSPSLLLQDAPTQLIHALAATYMAPGPTELLVTLWALAVVAPRAESVMGYSSFLVIYFLSGASGSLVQLAIMADAQPAGLGACGAAAAVLGVLGSLAVHHNTNRNVETQAASWRRSPSPAEPTKWNDTTNSPSSSGSTAALGSTASVTSLFQPPTRQEASQRSILVQAVCLAVASLGLAGMQHLQGHPSDPGGGAGMWGEVAWGMGVVPQLAGLATGMLLGLGMGPRYVVQRELHLDDGAMFIPEDAVDMLVVLDRTTTVQRGMTAAGVVTALALGWGAAGIS